MVRQRSAKPLRPGSNPGGASRNRKTSRKTCLSFSTKSVLTDGINPSSMDEITCVMKSDFVGLWTDLISSAKQISSKQRLDFTVSTSERFHFLKEKGHNDGIDYAYRETDLIKRLLSYRKSNFAHIPEPCEEIF